MNTHGITKADYNNLPKSLTPALECFCSIALTATTWQEAEAALDRH